MTEQNQARNIVKIICEVCQEENIKAEFFSYDWIIKLTKNNKTKYIWGYTFELNSATAQIIASDKSATSELLAESGLPTVEHKLFLSPKMDKYVPLAGNWPNILTYFKKNNQKLVAKPNSNSSSGSGVFLIANQLELEKAVNYLFFNYRGLSLSPFYEIKNEYRVIILDRKAELIYQKEIPYLIGDGQASLINLFLAKYSDKEDLAFFIKKIEEDENFNLSDILAKGEIIKLGWKHNLKGGAIPLILKNPETKNKLINLARKAANAINIAFASVDIIETKDNNFLVLEINSGIMMEHFASSSSENYQKAKKIYAKAILKMLNLSPCPLS